jgi:hypothetical protein
VFLAGLNAPAFAGHLDWRLPVIWELQSILVGSAVTTTSTTDPLDSAMDSSPFWMEVERMERHASR